MILLILIILSFSTQLNNTYDIKPVFFFDLKSKYSAISVAPTGNIFLLSTEQSLVQSFSSDGKVLHQFGGKGSGTQFLDRPNHINAHLDLSIGIADTYNDRIVILNNTLGFISSIDGNNSLIPELNFRFPISTIKLPNGTWVILENETKSLIFYHVQRKELFRVGGMNFGNLPLLSPQKLVIGKQNFIVTDRSDSSYHWIDFYGNPMRKTKATTLKPIFFLNEWFEIADFSLQPFPNNPLNQLLLSEYIDEPIIDVTVKGTVIYVLTEHKVVALQISLLQNE